MSMERKIEAEQLPDYHVLAAAARREQSFAVRDAFTGAARWVRGLFISDRPAAGSAAHLG